MSNYPYRPQPQNYSMMNQPSQQAMQVSYPGPFQPPITSASYSSPPQMPMNNFRWVQGRAGANAERVNPGETAILLDTEEPVFYIKTVDYSGMPMPLRMFDYTERFQVEEKESYVSRTEFDELKNRFDDQSKQLADLIGGAQ